MSIEGSSFNSDCVSTAVNGILSFKSRLYQPNFEILWFTTFWETTVRVDFCSFYNLIQTWRWWCDISEEIVKSFCSNFTKCVEHYRTWSVGIFIKRCWLVRYNDILKRLGYEDRKAIALEITKGLLKNRNQISTVNEVNKLFELIKPLIKDEEDTPDEINEVWATPNMQLINK